MAPKSHNPKAPARGATTQDGSPSARPRTDPREETQPDSDYDDAAESVTITQLQDQIQSLQADRQRDHDLLAQILAQVTKNNTQLGALPTQTRPTLRTIERDTPDSTISSLDANLRHYSKKLPDPPPLSDGSDLTFASWKI